MLFIIHVVWGMFFNWAARNPLAYPSLLNFTMWAYLLHGLLMAVEAHTDLSNLA
jgi:hypothetical protein